MLSSQRTNLMEFWRSGFFKGPKFLLITYKYISQPKLKEICGLLVVFANIKVGSFWPISLRFTTNELIS